MDYMNKYAIIIDKVCDRTVLGKKMLQKLMYLMERKGVDLNLNYSIHFFGPYSSMLDSIIHVMAMKDILNIDTSGSIHKITVRDLGNIDNNLNEPEVRDIDFVLDNFSNRTASELEAITTLDYIATEVLENKGTDRDIIKEVKKIKGNKYTAKYLMSELNVLKKFDFLG